MNLTSDQALAILLLLVDRAPKNAAELIGAQAAFAKLSEDAKELQELMKPKAADEPKKG